MVKGKKIEIDNIKNMINLKNKFWIHFLSTNCYAYALGLDVSEKNIIDFAYQPGVISGSASALNNYKYFSYYDLLENIYADMERLDIDIRETDIEYKTRDYEWKIALFTTFYSYKFDDEFLSDYHFLREVKDGVWFHKEGYSSFPTNKDYNNKVIVNPLKSSLGSNEFKKCYVLKLK